MSSISGDAMAALVMAAGLAALMSTMDSQLLTLSSIITRDIFPVRHRSHKAGAARGKIAVVCLSAAGFALSLNPPATILQIATQTFTGLAVLFPSVVFGLYLKHRFASSAMVSVIAGESVVAALYLHFIEAGPFLPIVWAAAASFSGYIVAHLILLQRKGLLEWKIPALAKNPYIYVFSAILLLSIDFWAWNFSTPLVLGLPVWLPYFVFLSAAQTIAMISLVRNTNSDQPPQGNCG
jgi:solute:Na+ symporter, SSS family